MRNINFIIFFIFLAKRRCRFDDEVEDLDIFEKYSQTACEFECKIKTAYEICQCYPWNVPSIPNTERHVICDIFSNLCYKTYMIKKTTEHNCRKKCVPSCNQVEFTSTEQSFKRDANSICSERRSLENNIAEDIMKSGYDSLLYKYMKITEWKSNRDELGEKFNDTLEPYREYQIKSQLCKSIVNNHISKVSVMFDRPKYMRTERNLRVTFADQLGALGKIVEFFELLIL